MTTVSLQRRRTTTFATCVARLMSRHYEKGEREIEDESLRGNSEMVREALLGPLVHHEK